jgi:hypothetical protein
MVWWGIIIILSLLLAGCYSPQISTGETFFRSDECHLEVMLPPGWAVAGLKELVPDYTGLVAFNSWGGAGFWPGTVTRLNSCGVRVTGYFPEGIMEQIPDGGAYVQLTESWGPAPAPGYAHYAGEHEREDLGGLWERKDWRVGETTQGVTTLGFYKWGRSLDLGVYCDQDASDATIEAVNALLESWRFDAVVPGDIGWAAVEARHLLPPEVEPMKFPVSSPWLRPGSGAAVACFSGQHGNVSRITQANVRGETVVITFMYRWGDPERNWSTECPTDRCHWWKIEARPSGEVVLIEEGGAVLPGGTNE